MRFANFKQNKTTSYFSLISAFLILLLFITPLSAFAQDDAGIDTGPVIMQSLLSSKKFKVYEDVLNMQIFMLKQIMIWLRDGRIHIRERNVYIDDAGYTIGEYVPALEFDV